MEEEKRQFELLEEAKGIELLPVVSSNINAIGYNQDKRLLKVAFKSKDKSNVYLYENVGPEIYDGILKSESVGKYIFETVIKDKEKYKYIRL